MSTTESTLQSRQWRWTLNNPEDDQLDHLTNSKYHRYTVFQLEEAPKTGTPHYQGYTEFTRPVRQSAMKKLIPRANLQSRTDDRDAARRYCMKEETRLDGPWEFGEWISGQGHRSDLTAVAKIVKDGATIREVAYEYPVQFIKYHKGIEKLISLQPKLRLTEPGVFVLYGKAGTGKTRTVYDNYDLEDIYPVMEQSSGTQYFDGYSNHKVALFDDFYGGIKYSFMLRLLDRYPLQVHTKGGTTYWQPDIIIITSNKHPKKWYNLADQSALKRRITKVYFYNKKGAKPSKRKW